MTGRPKGSKNKTTNGNKYMQISATENGNHLVTNPIIIANTLYIPLAKIYSAMKAKFLHNTIINKDIGISNNIHFLFNAIISFILLIL